MFGVFRVAKARQACVTALNPVIRLPEKLRPWPAAFWRDPYVLGFVVGVIAITSSVITRVKLTAAQRGRVLIGTLRELDGYSPNVVGLIEGYGRNRNPDYELGQQNGSKLALFIFGSHAFDDDPDVASATEIAKDTTLDGHIDHAAVGGALMHLLFQMPVRERMGG